MNVWSVGEKWYTNSDRKEFKNMGQIYFKIEKVGIGYSPSDIHGKTAWKKLKSVEKGDIIYIKEISADKGQFIISGIGIVIKDIGNQLDNPIEEMENGYGLDVKWISKESFLVDAAFHRGAFYQENRKNVTGVVIRKVAEWGIQRIVDAEASVVSVLG